MKNYKDLDKLLRDSLNEDIQPSNMLNYNLKSKINEELEERRSFWYVPALVNSILFGLIAFFAVIFIDDLISKSIIIGVSMYLIIEGIVLTVIGVKFSNLKEATFIK